MPKILEWNGFKFFFFSNEGYPLEPEHIHVRKAEMTAKIWLVPEVKVAEAYGFDSNALRIILNKVSENETLFKEKWNEYFGL